LRNVTLPLPSPVVGAEPGWRRAKGLPEGAGCEIRPLRPQKESAARSMPSAAHGLWFILEICVCAVNFSPGVVTRLVRVTQRLWSLQQVSSASACSRRPGVEVGAVETCHGRRSADIATDADVT